MFQGQLDNFTMDVEDPFPGLQRPSTPEVLLARARDALPEFSLVTPPPPVNDIRLSGYLLKRGDNGKYRRRYCTLDGETLSLVYSKDHKRAPHQSIQLVRVEVGEDSRTAVFKLRVDRRLRRVLPMPLSHIGAERVPAPPVASLGRSPTLSLTNAFQLSSPHLPFAPPPLGGPAVPLSPANPPASSLPPPQLTASSPSLMLSHRHTLALADLPTVASSLSAAHSYSAARAASLPYSPALTALPPHSPAMATRAHSLKPSTSPVLGPRAHTHAPLTHTPLGATLPTAPALSLSPSISIGPANAHGHAHAYLRAPSPLIAPPPLSAHARQPERGRLRPRGTPAPAPTAAASPRSRSRGSRSSYSSRSHSRSHSRSCSHSASGVGGDGAMDVGAKVRVPGREAERTEGPARDTAAADGVGVGVYEPTMHMYLDPATDTATDATGAVGMPSASVSDLRAPGVMHTLAPPHTPVFTASSPFHPHTHTSAAYSPFLPLAPSHSPLLRPAPASSASLPLARPPAPLALPSSPSLIPPRTALAQAARARASSSAFAPSMPIMPAPMPMPAPMTGTGLGTGPGPTAVTGTVPTADGGAFASPRAAVASVVEAAVEAAVGGAVSMALDMGNHGMRARRRVVLSEDEWAHMLVHAPDVPQIHAAGEDEEDEEAWRGRHAAEREEREVARLEMVGYRMLGGRASDDSDSGEEEDEDAEGLWDAGRDYDEGAYWGGGRDLVERDDGARPWMPRPLPRVDGAGENAGGVPSHAHTLSHMLTLPPSPSLSSVPPAYMPALADTQAAHGEVASAAASGHSRPPSASPRSRAHTRAHAHKQTQGQGRAPAVSLDQLPEVFPASPHTGRRAFFADSTGADMDASAASPPRPRADRMIDDSVAAAAASVTGGDGAPKSLTLSTDSVATASTRLVGAAEAVEGNRMRVVCVEPLTPMYTPTHATPITPPVRSPAVTTPRAASPQAHARSHSTGLPHGQGQGQGCCPPLSRPGSLSPCATAPVPAHASSLMSSVCVPHSMSVESATSAEPWGLAHMHSLSSHHARGDSPRSSALTLTQQRSQPALASPVRGAAAAEAARRASVAVSAESRTPALARRSSLWVGAGDRGAAARAQTLGPTLLFGAGGDEFAEVGTSAEASGRWEGGREGGRESEGGVRSRERTPAHTPTARGVRERERERDRADRSRGKLPWGSTDTDGRDSNSNASVPGALLGAGSLGAGRSVGDNARGRGDSVALSAGGLGEGVDARIEALVRESVFSAVQRQVSLAMSGASVGSSGSADRAGVDSVLRDGYGGSRPPSPHKPTRGSVASVGSSGRGQLAALVSVAEDDEDDEDVTVVDTADAHRHSHRAAAAMSGATGVSVGSAVAMDASSDDDEAAWSVVDERLVAARSPPRGRAAGHGADGVWDSGHRDSRDSRNSRGSRDSTHLRVPLLAHAPVFPLSSRRQSRPSPRASPRLHPHRHARTASAPPLDADMGVGTNAGMLGGLTDAASRTLRAVRDALGLGAADEAARHALAGQGRLVEQHRRRRGKAGSLPRPVLAPLDHVPWQPYAIELSVPGRVWLLLCPSLQQALCWAQALARLRAWALWHSSVWDCTLSHQRTAAKFKVGAPLALELRRAAATHSDRARRLQRLQWSAGEAVATAKALKASVRARRQHRGRALASSEGRVGSSLARSDSSASTITLSSPPPAYAIPVPPIDCSLPPLTRAEVAAARALAQRLLRVARTLTRRAAQLQEDHLRAARAWAAPELAAHAHAAVYASGKGPLPPGMRWGAVREARVSGGTHLLQLLPLSHNRDPYDPTPPPTHSLAAGFTPALAPPLLAALPPFDPVRWAAQRVPRGDPQKHRRRCAACARSLLHEPAWFVCGACAYPFCDRCGVPTDSATASVTPGPYAHLSGARHDPPRAGDEDDVLNSRRCLACARALPYIMPLPAAGCAATVLVDVVEANGLVFSSASRVRCSLWLEGHKVTTPLAPASPAPRLSSRVLLGWRGHGNALTLAIYRQRVAPLTEECLGVAWVCLAGLLGDTVHDLWLPLHPPPHEDDDDTDPFAYPPADDAPAPTTPLQPVGHVRVRVVCSISAEHLIFTSARAGMPPEKPARFKPGELVFAVKRLGGVIESLSLGAVAARVRYIRQYEHPLLSLVVTAVLTLMILFFPASLLVPLLLLSVCVHMVAHLIHTLIDPRACTNAHTQRRGEGPHSHRVQVLAPVGLDEQEHQTLCFAHARDGSGAIVSEWRPRGRMRVLGTLQGAEEWVLERHVETLGGAEDEDPCTLPPPSRALTHVHGQGGVLGEDGARASYDDMATASSTADEEEEESDGIFAVVERIRATLTQVQRSVNVGCDWAERLQNLARWRYPRASGLAFVLLIAVTVLLALVPLRAVLLVLLVLQMSKRLRALRKLQPPVEEAENVVERVPVTHMLWPNKRSVPKELVRK